MSIFDHCDIVANLSDLSSISISINFKCNMCNLFIPYKENNSNVIGAEFQPK